MPALTAVENSDLTFASGLPGFPEAHRFAMSFPFGDDSPFALLQSIDEPALSFVVVPPHLFFPDYAPEIDDATVERLAITSADDAALFVVVTVGESVTDSTANLLGPIVVNRHTNEAVQTVLAKSDHPLRAPLF